MLQETVDREEIIARVAALDIGKAELVCCVRVPDEDRPDFERAGWLVPCPPCQGRVIPFPMPGGRRPSSARSGPLR